MKFINKVMVFVMGLVVIGVASTTIGVVTQSKTVEKNVTFELLDNGTYTPNVFDKISLYSVVDDDYYNNIVVNIQLLKLNDSDVTQGSSVVLSQNDFSIYILSSDGSDTFRDDGSFVMEDGVFQDGDIITFTFAVEVKTPVIIKTLLVLIPLILSTSLIGYLSLRGSKNE